MSHLKFLFVTILQIHYVTSVIPLKIEVENGKIRGLHLKTAKNTSYAVFLGIPYAQPPVGELRFRPPEPPKNWSDIFNATQDGDICVQTTISKLLEGGVVGSEDCLFINVYTPAKKTNSKLPVMVWFYGGGFMMGDSMRIHYNPEPLLEEGIIFVSFNYRLGIFGFMASEDPSATGNAGVKDQILALKWIRSNIAFFGGDPDKVTLFGQSAGAACISYLLGIREVKGLFVGAIQNSGTALSIWALSRHAKEQTINVAENMGIETKDVKAMLQELRRADYKKLQRVSFRALFSAIISNNMEDVPFFAPVIETPNENEAITFKAHEAFALGRFHKVPILIGFNSYEGSFLPDVGQSYQLILSHIIGGYMKDTSKFVPNDLPNTFNRTRLGNIIKKFYIRHKQQEDFLRYVGDNYFIVPIRETVRLISNHKVPVYFYEFLYQNGNKNSPGVSHGKELTYFFKNMDNPSEIDKGDLLTAKRLIRLWSNFVKYGDPTPHMETLLQKIIWLPASKAAKGSLAYLKIAKNLTMANNPHHSYIKFWRTIYRKFGKPPFDTY